MEFDTAEQEGRQALFWAHLSVGPRVRTDGAFVFALNVFPSSGSLSFSSLVFTEMSEVKRFGNFGVLKSSVSHFQ